MYFKGYFVGTGTTRVGWCLSGTAALLALSRTHLYLVKVSSCCVLHFSGSVPLADFAVCGQEYAPLFTLPC